MSMASLERAILAELKTVAGNPKLKLKNIMAWETGRSDKPIETQAGETAFFLPELRVWCAVKVEA